MGILPLVAVCCSTTERANRRIPSVAVAVRTGGALPPSPEQIGRIHRALEPELARAGFTIAAGRDTADYVVTVQFTPAGDGSGGRVFVTSIEPSVRFRNSTADDDAPEGKEWRRRLRDIEQWIERQARDY